MATLPLIAYKVYSEDTVGSDIYSGDADGGASFGQNASLLLFRLPIDFDKSLDEVDHFRLNIRARRIDSGEEPGWGQRHFANTSNLGYGDINGSAIYSNRGTSTGTVTMGVDGSSTTVDQEISTIFSNYQIDLTQQFKDLISTMTETNFPLDGGSGQREVCIFIGPEAGTIAFGAYIEIVASGEFEPSVDFQFSSVDDSDDTSIPPDDSDDTSIPPDDSDDTSIPDDSDDTSIPPDDSDDTSVPPIVIAKKRSLFANDLW